MLSIKFRSVITILTPYSIFFFFNDTATTEIYTLSLHDALPIYGAWNDHERLRHRDRDAHGAHRYRRWRGCRSEEHTSELQSPCNLVCRLLLEKKKNYAYSVCRSRCKQIRMSKRDKMIDL